MAKKSKVKSGLEKQRLMYLLTLLGPYTWLRLTFAKSLPLEALTEVREQVNQGRLTLTDESAARLETATVEAKLVLEMQPGRNFNLERFLKLAPYLQEGDVFKIAG